jgi:dolichyl-phosphate beta-glucosyltransferase
MIYLSIIIPAYNEEKRIAVTLEKIRTFLVTKKYDFEIIVVDDGSIDRTGEVVKNSGLFKENKLKVLKNGTNKGKGFSIRNGIINSQGEYVLFSDSDLSTPIEEVDKLFEFIGKGYDIVIGSRGLKDSDVRIHQPWYREVMGKTFNVIVKTLIMKVFSDTQCGFKLFKAAVAKDIVSNLKIDGFSFDVEMLYVALKKGYKIKEVPIMWLNSPKSTVSPILDSTKMFIDLIKIKMMHG